MNAADWLNAIAAHPETIDIDLLVAAFLAQEPDRLWSLSDVLHGLHRERELSDLRDAVKALVGDGFLDEIVAVECDEHRDNFWCDECADPLCGDMLFRIIEERERKKMQWTDYVNEQGYASPDQFEEIAHPNGTTAWTVACWAAVALSWPGVAPVEAGKVSTPTKSGGSCSTRSARACGCSAKRPRGAKKAGTPRRQRRRWRPS